LQGVVCRQAVIFRRACKRAELIDMFTFSTHRLPAGRELMQRRKWRISSSATADAASIGCSQQSRMMSAGFSCNDRSRLARHCLFVPIRRVLRPRLARRANRRESTQVDEIDLAVESGAHLMSNCHRYGGLANATRPDDRHEVLLGKLHLDRGERLSSSEQPHQARRQSRPRGWFEIPRRWRGK
jgi:hypothetical protein